MTDATKIEHLDFSCVNPAEAVHSAAAICIDRGLSPCKFRVSPTDYRNIEVGLRYLHEYLDEESRSYLVVRIPERFLVYVDRKAVPGTAFVECRNPDVEVRVLLAY